MTEAQDGVQQMYPSGAAAVCRAGPWGQQQAPSMQHSPVREALAAAACQQQGCAACRAVGRPAGIMSASNTGGQGHAQGTQSNRALHQQRLVAERRWRLGLSSRCPAEAARPACDCLAQACCIWPADVSACTLSASWPFVAGQLLAVGACRHLAADAEPPSWPDRLCARNQRPHLPALRCRGHPGALMGNLLRALQTHGVAWKKSTPFGLKCRGIFPGLPSPPTRHASASGARGQPRMPKLRCRGPWSAAGRSRPCTPALLAAPWQHQRACRGCRLPQAACPLDWQSLRASS